MATSNHNTIKLLLIIINHCEPLSITLEIPMDHFYFICATNLEANFKNAYIYHQNYTKLLEALLGPRIFMANEFTNTAFRIK